MKIVRVEINSYNARQSMVLALAESEYKVWIEETPIEGDISTNYWVCFEIPDNNIKED